MRLERSLVSHSAPTLLVTYAPNSLSRDGNYEGDGAKSNFQFPGNQMRICGAYFILSIVERFHTCLLLNICHELLAAVNDQFENPSPVTKTLRSGIQLGRNTMP
jgi:hypothetical protein